MRSRGQERKGEAISKQMLGGPAQSPPTSHFTAHQPTLPTATAVSFCLRLSFATGTCSATHSRSGGLTRSITLQGGHSTPQWLPEIPGRTELWLPTMITCLITARTPAFPCLLHP